MIARCRSRLSDDSGASLLLVMGLLLIVGLVVSATLSYASTSIHASAAIADRVDDSYDVDGALQAGINQLRNSSYVDQATPGGGTGDCPTLVVPGPSAGRDVTVTCESAAGSGALTRAIDKRLPQALLATGIGARTHEDGIVLTSADDLSVAGDIASNSTIAAGKGTLVAIGSVTAVSGCSDGVDATTKDCSADPVAVPDVRQPRSGFVARAVPSCPRDGSTVIFEPGYYDDAEALSQLMDSCADSTFWFPGAAGGAPYYFDFHNGEPGYPAGSHAWTIRNPDVRVVAGGRTAPGKPGTVHIPGSCPSPLTTAANAGVTFVFGGDSRVKVTAGQVELCGPGDAARGAPPVAIFGADSDLGDGGPGTAGPSTAPTGSRVDRAGMLTMTPGSASNVRSGSEPIATFGMSTTQQDRIVDWDDLAATAVLDGSEVPGGQQGIVRVSGYRPADASPTTTIPAGATLTYARLYVRHRETRIRSGKDPVAFIHVDVTPDRAGAAQVGPASPADGFTPGLGVNPDSRRKLYRVDTVDLLATAALQDEVTEHGFAGATVQWLVQSKDGLDLTADLDTIQLAIGWTAPRQLRAQTTLIDGDNCVTSPTTAHPGSGACALVATTNAEGQTTFHVQGTGFAPRAAFELRHRRIAAPVFTAGLVGRQLTFGLTSQSSPPYPGPAVSVPVPLTVLLRAYTCPGESCPEAAGSPPLPEPWHLAGTATVRYADPGSQIRPGAREVSVLTWSTYP